LLFNNVTIRLIGSDNLSEAEQRQAITDIEACLDAGVLRPHIAQRFPLSDIAAAHEFIEGPHAPGHIILDIS
jgi:NADPH2:quinone reductase